MCSDKLYWNCKMQAAGLTPLGDGLQKVHDRLQGVRLHHWVTVTDVLREVLESLQGVKLHHWVTSH